MPLDELLETVETLRRLLTEQGAALRRSEGQTRSALIDPLLQQLGWDTHDLSQVVPEYQYGSTHKRADYALLDTNGKPVIILEAKRLGESMQAAVTQGIDYSRREGTPYLAVSDGQKWEIYKTPEQEGMLAKLLTSFDLTDAPVEVCLKAIALWRRSVTEAKIGIAGIHAMPPAPVASQPEPEDSAPPTEGGWIPLLDVPARKGDRALLEVRLPDGTQKSLTSAKSVLVEAVSWCITRNLIPQEDLPLRGGNPRYFILAASPFHSDGQPFAEPWQINDSWVPTSGDLAELVGRARRIIEHAGLDPADFKVRLAD